jgi:hypothetical protein
MSINNLNTYLNIKDSHLRVVSGNVYAQAMNIGGINIETAHGLQSVSDTGNVTSNTIQFSNATTGFVTTANVEVGGELTVSSNLTVGGNVVADYLYGDGSNISGISSSNLQVVTDTGNVTSNTVQFTNPTTAFKATSNLELTSASKIVVESNVLMDFKTLGQIEFPGSTVEQEYPPRGLTGHETLVEGHGVFYAYASSEVATGSYHSYQAFNKIQAAPWSENTWNTHNPSYSTSTGLPTGAELGGHDGEWLKLQLPYRIKVNSYQIQIYGAYYEYAPDSWVIIGSNDNNNWETIDSISASGFTNSGTVVTKNYTVSNTKYYEYLALVCTKLDPQYSKAELKFSELRFFGTPGPTTLDKGSLTLGRSLDVPRISRYDVDTETPRPEKLLLDLDTTVNSSPTDISGKGNHGVFGGSASYSAADKAFVVGGPSDYVIAGPNAVLDAIRGDKSHTISLWVKFDIINQSGIPTWIFHAGRSAHSAVGSKIYINPGYGVDGFFFDSSYGAGWPGGPNYTNAITSGDTALVVNKWYHVTAVYDSVDSKGYMYVDGILKDSDTMTDFNIYTGHSTSGYIDGQVQLGGTEGGYGASTQGHKYSNPKLYNVALEASEVQKLYRLGRTGRSMVISDTAVGIGKVPEAQLDVRGVLKCDKLFVGDEVMSSSVTIAFSTYWSPDIGDGSTTGTYTPTQTYYNYGNGFDTSNGRFTAPINGVYHIDWNSYTNNGSPTTNSKIILYKNGTAFITKGPTMFKHGQNLSATLYLAANEYIHIGGGGATNPAYPLYYYSNTGKMAHYSGYLVSAT